MPAYLIAFVQPTDKAFAEYPPLVPKTLEPYSGKIILKCFVAEEVTNGGPEFKERSTADDFKIAVAIEFPTLDKAMAWKNSDEYQAIIGIRLENSTTESNQAESSQLVNQFDMHAITPAHLPALPYLLDRMPIRKEKTKEPATGMSSYLSSMVAMKAASLPLNNGSSHGTMSGKSSVTSTNSAIKGYFSEASTYTTNVMNQCFVWASIAMVLVWIALVIAVERWVPRQYFRMATETERQMSIIGTSVLLVSIMTQAVPLLLRGWRRSYSGAMVGAFAVQSVSVFTSIWMTMKPIPVMVDPVTQQEQYLMRYAEWVPLTFMMLFLTEGVGLADMTPGSPIWPHIKLPVLLSLALMFTVSLLFVFPFAPSMTVWVTNLTVAMSIFSLLFPRLLYKRQQFLNCPSGNSIDARQWYDRCRLSYTLLALCLTMWSSLVIMYYVLWLVPKFVSADSRVNQQGMHFVVETIFEVMSKVLYLHVTADIHCTIFDEGVRATWRLEELRNMVQAARKG